MFIELVDTLRCPRPHEESWLVLSARLLALMRPAPSARYGLGLAAFHTPCGTAIGHTGALLGTVSAAWSSRDGRRRVVAMSNSFPLSPSAGAALR